MASSSRSRNRGKAPTCWRPRKRRAGRRARRRAVNDDDSPLAHEAHHRVPLGAGVEHSVAATKSYIASLAALRSWLRRGLTTTGCSTRSRGAGGTRASLGTRLGAAAGPLRDARNLFVIGRGFGLGIAQEAALKLKETCGIHAESFSAAEVRHGPQALLQGGFPVFVFAQDDETRAGIEALARELVARGVQVLAAGRQRRRHALPTVEAHPAIEPLLMAQSFYRLANALAMARGLDPDRPPHLRKVTETA